jgi:hypothetical protein
MRNISYLSPANLSPTHYGTPYSSGNGRAAHYPPDIKERTHSLKEDIHTLNAQLSSLMPILKNPKNKPSRYDCIAFTPWEPVSIDPLIANPTSIVTSTYENLLTLVEPLRQMEHTQLQLLYELNLKVKNSNYHLLNLEDELLNLKDQYNTALDKAKNARYEEDDKADEHRAYGKKLHNQSDEHENQRSYHIDKLKHYKNEISRLERKRFREPYPTLYIDADDEYHLREQLKELIKKWKKDKEEFESRQKDKIEEAIRKINHHDSLADSHRATANQLIKEGNVYINNAQQYSYTANKKRADYKQRVINNYEPQIQAKEHSYDSAIERYLVPIRQLRQRLNHQKKLLTDALSDTKPKLSSVFECEADRVSQLMPPNHQSAIKLYTKAIELGNYYHLYSKRGDSYKKCKYYKEAYNDYTIAKEPSKQTALLMHINHEALAFYKQNNHAQGIKLCTLGLSLCWNATLYNTRGYLHEKLGNNSEAYKDFSEASKEISSAQTNVTRVQNTIIQTHYKAYQAKLKSEMELYNILRTKWRDLKNSREGFDNEEAQFNRLTNSQDKVWNDYFVNKNGQFTLTRNARQHLNTINQVQRIFYKHLLLKHGRSELGDLINTIQNITQQHGLEEKAYLNLHRPNKLKQFGYHIANYHQRKTLNNQSKFLQNIQLLLNNLPTNIE